MWNRRLKDWTIKICEFYNFGLERRKKNVVSDNQAKISRRLPLKKRSDGKTTTEMFENIWKM